MKNSNKLSKLFINEMRKKSRISELGNVLNKKNQEFCAKFFLTDIANDYEVID